MFVYISFAGNSAILRRSCYKEVTFYLTIKVLCSQQHIVQRKCFLYACSSNSQELFTNSQQNRCKETIPYFHVSLPVSLM